MARRSDSGIIYIPKLPAEIAYNGTDQLASARLRANALSKIRLGEWKAFMGEMKGNGPDDI